MPATAMPAQTSPDTAALVARIDARPDAADGYAALASRYLRPAARAAMQGRLDAAEALYVEMVGALEALLDRA